MATSLTSYIQSGREKFENLNLPENANYLSGIVTEVSQSPIVAALGSELAYKLFGAGADKLSPEQVSWLKDISGSYADPALGGELSNRYVEMMSAPASTPVGDVGLTVGEVAAIIAALKVGVDIFTGNVNMGTVGSAVSGIGAYAGAKAAASKTAAVAAKTATLVSGIGLAITIAAIGLQVAKARTNPLHSGERKFGGTLKGFVDTGMDSEIAFAMSRLLNPNEGGDSAGDATREIVGSYAVAGAKDIYSDDADNYFVKGVNKMIDQGMATKEEIMGLLQNDLTQFANPEFARRFAGVAIGEGVTYGAKQLKMVPSGVFTKKIERQAGEIKAKNTISHVQNLVKDKTLISQYEKDFNQALREAGRGDIQFDRSAINRVMAIDEGEESYTTEQRAGIMMNNLNKVFAIGDDDSGRTAIRPEVLTRLMNENPRIKELMNKFKGEVTQPIVQEITPTDPAVQQTSQSKDLDAGITDRLPELPYEKSITKSVTEFVAKGKSDQPRSTGLLGAGNAPQVTRQDTFMDSYANNPIAMRILAEETAKAGPPFTNPNSPWYDPERASTYNYSYHSREVGAGKAQKRLEEMGVNVQISASTPTGGGGSSASPEIRHGGIASFTPPDVVKQHPDYSRPEVSGDEAKYSMSVAPLAKSISELRNLATDESYSLTSDERKRLDQANWERRKQQQDDYS